VENETEENIEKRYSLTKWMGRKTATGLISSTRDQEMRRGMTANAY
jgi:hypothetical protein